MREVSNDLTHRLFHSKHAEQVVHYNTSFDLTKRRGYKYIDLISSINETWPDIVLSASALLAETILAAFKQLALGTRI